MSDEDFILCRDSFANERMRGDFASGTDDCGRLNLHKGTNRSLIPHLATVEVHELRLRNSYVAAEQHVGGDGHLEICGFRGRSARSPVFRAILTWPGGEEVVVQPFEASRSEWQVEAVEFERDQLSPARPQWQGPDQRACGARC